MVMVVISKGNKEIEEFLRIFIFICWINIIILFKKKNIIFKFGIWW